MINNMHDLRFFFNSSNIKSLFTDMGSLHAYLLISVDEIHYVLCFLFGWFHFTVHLIEKDCLP